MMHARSYQGLLPAIFLFFVTALPTAAQEPRISDPSYLDRQFMAQQRALRGQFGGVFGIRLDGLRHAEVQDLRLTIGAAEDVRRLEVTVQDLAVVRRV